MAEATKVGLEDEAVKDKFLSCSICLERFTDPKVLPCLHTFCVLCLDSYIKKTSKNNEFLCPVCRTATKVPSNGAAEFKTNFFMNSLVDFFWGRDVQRYCSVCSLHDITAPATSKCVDCSDYLCAACSKVHRQTRFTARHSVISLEDIYSQEKSAEIAAKRTFPCSEHPEENVRYYCTACDKPVCRDCKALSHHDHKCVAFQEAIQERKPIIQEKIKHLTKKYQAVQSEVAGLEKYHENVQQEHSLFVDEVERIYQTFLKSLSDFRSQILQDTKSRTEQVLKQNNMALEETKTISAQLYSYREYLSTTVDRAADVEILDTFKMSKEHLDTLCARTSRPDGQDSVTLDQYTSANSKTIKRFLLDCHNSLDKITKSVQPKLKQGVVNMTSTFVRKLPSPVANKPCSGLALSEDGDLYACCDGKVYQYTQCWKDITSEIGVQDVEAYDMIMDGETLMVSTGYDDIGVSVCRIVFHKPATKTSTITHLNFSCGCPGICLRRDSSTMYVTDSRNRKVREINRDGSVLKLWEPISPYFSPCYVTQCKDGHVFVSDWNGGVEILTPDLKYENSLDNPLVNGPTGLQIDDTGNVYLASEMSNAVYLLSSDGTLKTTVLCYENGIKYPRSLSLTKDKLAVGHKHGVWIYTLH